jgi:hypothetical protein
LSEPSDKEVIVLYNFYSSTKLSIRIPLSTTTTLPFWIRATLCNAQIEINYITVATNERKIETMGQTQELTRLRLPAAEEGGAMPGAGGEAGG